MSTFKAIVLDESAQGRSASLREFSEEDLMEGDTLVRVTFSSLNYKDGLAITGRAPVVRRYPMIPGIDFIGVVEQTSDPMLAPGDRVILNGWGAGETHLGGYAARARVPGKWLIALPAELEPAQAMSIGTAGYTAALCVMALERSGVKPEQGEVLVTGAAGGVGSLAVQLLSAAGWTVIASTGRMEERDYLKSLGAKEVISRDELTAPGKPLGREQWIAAVDVVGSRTLANVLAKTKYGGVVTACGLAGGLELPTTVAPFILRGVSLIGIDSVMAPRELRLAAWSLLEKSIDRDALGRMTRTISLSEVISAAPQILDGKIRGRVVVRVDEK